MSQIHIAVIVGSLRKDSFNRQLAQAVIKMAPAGVQFTPVPIGDLPCTTRMQMAMRWQLSSSFAMRCAVWMLCCS